MSTQFTKQLFLLDLSALPATKSKDDLFVRYNPTLSRIRSEQAGHEVSVYDVLNMSERTASEVEFSNVRGRKLGGCTCESRVICKHLTRAVGLHVYRKRAEQTLAAQSKTDAQLWRDALA